MFYKTDLQRLILILIRIRGINPKKDIVEFKLGCAYVYALLEYKIPTKSDQVAMINKNQLIDFLKLIARDKKTTIFYKRIFKRAIKYKLITKIKTKELQTGTNSIYILSLNGNIFLLGKDLAEEYLS